MLKSEIAPKLLPFLTTTKSLTKKLENLSKKPLTVKVLSQKSRLLTLTEKKMCQLPLHRPILAWERKVLLFGDNPPSQMLEHQNSNQNAWIEATSLFPYNSLLGKNKRLKHLKNTPIGYILFKKNKELPFKRQFIILPHHISRQTVYQLNHKPIIIEEIFLPAFLDFLLQNH